MSQSPEDVSKIITAVADREAVPTDCLTEVQPDLELGLEEHKLEFQVQCLWQELNELKDTHQLRLAYTGRIYWLVVGWLACVVLCIGLSGFSFTQFKLPEAVLIAFIGSTTVNVVGLFVLVAKWMYPSAAASTVSRSGLHSKADALRTSARGETKRTSPNAELP